MIGEWRSLSQHGEPTGALPGRLVRNPKTVGVEVPAVDEALVKTNAQRPATITTNLAEGEHRNGNGTASDGMLGPSDAARVVSEMEKNQAKKLAEIQEEKARKRAQQSKL